MAFFMYTGMVYDVSSSGAGDIQNITQANLFNPTFSFDMMDLFMLAEYLDVTDLVTVLRENFITPRSLFSPVTFEPAQSEDMVASMLARWVPFYQ